MRPKPLRELLVVIVFVSVVVFFLRDDSTAKQPASTDTVSSGGDPDLLLCLALDGDASSRGALVLDIEAREVEHKAVGGASGGYAVFGGQSWLSIGNAREFNHMDEFTLSAWVKPGTLAEHANVISKVRPNRDFNLQLNQKGQVLTHVAEGSDYEFCVTDATVPTGRWTHLAATFEEHTWRIYINGRLEATRTVDRAPMWTGQSLTVGNLYKGAGEGIQGGLDDVRIYKRALSDDEIATQSRN